jgi:hypothetical protein
MIAVMGVAGMEVCACTAEAWGLACWVTHSTERGMVHVRIN